MHLPGAKVGRGISFKTNQVISCNDHLLAQLALLLGDFLELFCLGHLSMCEKFTGNGRCRNTQPFL